MESRFRNRALILVALISFLVLGTALGIPFDTTYRICCAVTCFLFVVEFALDYPAERWPRFGLWAVPLANIGLFFTPVLKHHASRGEIMLFALPDAIILLSAWLATFSANDDHQRAQRQTVILGLVVAVIFCAMLYTIGLAA